MISCTIIPIKNLKRQVLVFVASRQNVDVAESMVRNSYVHSFNVITVVDTTPVYIYTVNTIDVNNVKF